MNEPSDPTSGERGPPVSWPPVVELVPHRPPLLLVDQLVAWSYDAAECRATIRAEHPFSRGGLVPAVIAIELLAQTTAAYLGMLGRELRQPVERGLLLGAREIELSVDTFATGDTLRICTTRIWGHGTHWRFAGEVWCAGNRVVWGMLDVLRTPA